MTDTSEPVVDADPEDLAVTEGARAALPYLVEQLVRLGWQLDRHHVDDRRWRSVLRTLHYVTDLGEYRLVAVAGGQGAGKTTLVGNLYPQAEEWLEPNPGLGEQNPLLVVERSGLSEPRGVVLRRDQEAITVTATYGPQEVEEWHRVLRGADNQALLARLETVQAQVAAQATTRKRRWRSG